MPKFVKMSADEAQSKRRDHLAKAAGMDNAIIKAAKAPASWNQDQRSARFVMSTQGVDRYGDIVVTEGIDTAEFERNPVGLLFHSSRSWPVGAWSDLAKELNRRPPRLEGTLTMLPEGGPVKEVDEAAWMIANGGVRACSIGFMPDWDNVEGIVDDEGFWTGLKFNASSLLECSVCSVPANSQALIKQADGDPRLARELLEDVLDNWARSPEGLILPRAEFEAAYRTVTEKIAADDISEPAPKTQAFAAGGVVGDAIAPETATKAGDDEETSSFKSFLEAHVAPGDTVRVYHELVAKRGPAVFGEKGVTVEHDGTDKIDKFEFADGMTQAHKDVLNEHLLQLAEAETLAENKTATSVGTIEINVDATKFEEFDRAGKSIVKSIQDALAGMFRTRSPASVPERIEPIIVPAAAAVSAPDPEAARKALESAVLLRARLATKGRLAA